MDGQVILINEEMAIRLEILKEFYREVANLTKYYNVENENPIVYVDDLAKALEKVDSRWLAL